MEILLTEQFATSVRRSPGHCRAGIERLVSAAGPVVAPAAEYLDQQHLVGYSRGARRIAFWCLFASHAVAPEAASAPLAVLSRNELLELGVPRELVRRVQRVRSIPQLDAIPLQPDAAGRLRFKLLQQLQGVRALGADLKRRSPDARTFGRFLHGDITELMLNLEPAQRRVVQLAGPGAIGVRGVAGSGKTAVALHRVLHLLAQRSLLAAPRILLLAYNRSLANAARELLSSLGVAISDVEVATFHGLCRKLSGHRGGFVDDAEQRRLLGQALEQQQAAQRSPSSLWSYPLEFWKNEMHLIKGRVSQGLPQYLELPRTGAGRPLDKPGRELVWGVYQQYCRLCRLAGKIDWDDLVAGAQQRIQEQGREHSLYDHVLVDEAQDLSPLCLRLAQLLVRPQGSLLIAYDSAQSIYERAFRWRDCGIRLHGARSFAFTKNHRNTAQILDAARPLLEAIERDEIDNLGLAADECTLQPEPPERSGRRPRLLACERGREFEAVSRDIAAQIEQGVPPQNIAVLCFPNRVRDEMFETLRRAGVNCQRHSSSDRIRLRDPSVKLLPVKSAKGLEFPVIYFPVSQRWFSVPRSIRQKEDRDAYRAELRRTFYMAMTRAMSRLVLVFEKDQPADFIRPVVARG